MGIDYFEIDFNEDITKIYGENGSGKTTILHSMYYLFYGKDSSGSKKFDILPLDENNNVIENTKPTIESTICVDDLDIVLKRSLSGKTTSCYIDGVKMKVKEYQDFISENIVDEKTFMTLINPTFFGLNYKWSEQRSLIQDKLEVEDTVIEKEEYSDVKNEILHHGVEKIKKKYKDKYDEIDDSIKEDNGTVKYLNERLKTKKVDSNKEELVAEKENVKNEISNLEKTLELINPFKRQLNEIEFKIKNEELNHSNQIKQKQDDINKLKNDKNVLLSNYKKRSSDLNNVLDKCTYCGAKIDENKIKEQKKELNEEIESIKLEGKSLADEISLKENELEAFKLETNNTEDLTKQKEELIVKINDLESKTDMNKIKELRSKYELLITQTSEFDSIKEETEKLNNLNDKIKSDTIELDRNESMLNLVKKYHKEYSQLLADNLNSKLDTIQIKTFEELKNGDLKDSFEITMDGVPYHSLNSAGKIIAGIELIQLLKEFLDINFPIVIDNKESITKEYNINNQLITLSVSEGTELCKIMSDEEYIEKVIANLKEKYNIV